MTVENPVNCPGCHGLPLAGPLLFKHSRTLHAQCQQASLTVRITVLFSLHTHVANAVLHCSTCSVSEAVQHVR